jgi:hypothetical protein
LAELPSWDIGRIFVKWPKKLNVFNAPRKSFLGTRVSYPWSQEKNWNEPSIAEVCVSWWSKIQLMVGILSARPFKGLDI